MLFGSFSEQSFPLTPSDIVRLPARGDQSTRDWLAAAHRSLKHLLPAGAKDALLTADLIEGPGKAVDVFEHFGLERSRLGSLRSNWEGIAHTAQAAGAGREGAGEADAWPGFEDVWIPGHDELPLAGRLRWTAEPGSSAPVEADAIVILPGLLGDNRVLRTRDLATGLTAMGFHVLALELRGHGMTDRRTPEASYSFSSLETVDLLAVSRWLRSQPHVRRTGLIGFCWGANHALNTAWYDGCGGNHPGVEPRIRPHLGTLPEEQHFKAGILAFSPVLRFEELLDKLDVQRSRFREPVLAGLQASVRERMTRKGYPDPSGSLRRLIACELNRSKLASPEVEKDAYRFVRMLPYRDLSDDEKLNSAQVRTLIVHAANDPLAEAQDLADLFAKTGNPQVAGLILPGGGHIGFAAYAKNYYYNLIVNFLAGR